jgi:hypothetical protein
MDPNRQYKVWAIIIIYLVVAVGSAAVLILLLMKGGGFNITFGDKHHDRAVFACQAYDGGYIVAGYTDLYGPGPQEDWLVKTDARGHLVWKKTYGGEESDALKSVLQTPDGGYVAAGYTSSSGVGGKDAWLVRTDANGEI